jgi:hypothetical protein
MKLYHVWQEENNDSYSDMVVAAPDEETARDMNPGYGNDMIDWNKENFWGSWATKRENVKVKYLGEADSSIKERHVICSSFHAG